jgi:hypothetical protein
MYVPYMFALFQAILYVKWNKISIGINKGTYGKMNVTSIAWINIVPSYTFSLATIIVVR